MPMGYDLPNAHVAQLAEHVLGKDEVTRSIRVVGSMPCLTRPGGNALWVHGSTPRDMWALGSKQACSCYRIRNGWRGRVLAAVLEKE